MERYMIISHDPEENRTTACFRETYQEAKNAQFDLECGLGCDVEIYERVNNEYQFLES